MIDLTNKTEKEVEKIVGQIGTELYYDLLEKYIQLKEEHTRVLNLRNRTFIGPEDVYRRIKKSDRRSFNFAIQLSKLYINQVEDVPVEKLLNLLKRIEKLKIPAGILIGEHLRKVKEEYELEKQIEL